MAKEKARNDQKELVLAAANRATLPEDAQSTPRKNSKKGTGATRAGAKAGARIPSLKKGKARGTAHPTHGGRTLPSNQKGRARMSGEAKRAAQREAREPTPWNPNGTLNFSGTTPGVVVIRKVYPIPGGSSQRSTSTSHSALRTPSHLGRLRPPGGHSGRALPLAFISLEPEP